MSSASEVKNFNDLFNRYYDRFVRYAEGFVKDFQVAEDLVSESFASYWENRENLSADTRPQAYILTSVKNKCLNHLQQLKVRQRISRDISEHEEWMISLQMDTLQACEPRILFSKEVEAIINKTLDKLPLLTRRIFIMNRYDCLSYKEISVKMKLSTKAIEYHISKALTQFRISLKDFIQFLLLLFIFQ